MSLLKGIEVVNKMKDKMILEVEELKSENVTPCLGIVRIGNRGDDLSYERGARKRCDAVGIETKVFEFDENISHEDFKSEFLRINEDSNIHGILLFRPMPKHIDENEIKVLINPDKDIDSMSSQNTVKIFEGDNSGFPPCTPQAVMEIFENNNIDLEGKNVVIVGRSMVVGKPLSMMLLKKNATVTICHTRTKNMQDVCKGAEILIVAAGRPKVITSDYVSEGTIVIDVGINVDSNGALCGDVDFENVEKIASQITPVPGGVGTVTTSVLAKHVIKACRKLK